MRERHTEKTGVVVVGAGPVGLTAAALLALEGISCLVVEKRDCLSQVSRASTFHPPTLEIFNEIGIADAMLALGQIADRIQYRTNKGDVIAEFDHALLSEETIYPFRLHLEQSAVTPLLRDVIEASGNGKVLFDTEVLAVGSNTAHAWVDVRHQDGEARRIYADYVLGADGARSAVRSSLGINLVGEEYPGKVLRLVVRDNLEEHLTNVGQVSYIFADDGRSISLLKMLDCWRIIIRIPAEFDEKQVVLPEWYMPAVKNFIPSVPDRFDVCSLDIYGASKMVADAYYSGRVFLIGDATHLTNTRGGMNMNCGIHDAYELAIGVLRSLREGNPDSAKLAAQHRCSIAMNELIPRTDRNVSGGSEWVAQIRATGADQHAARDLLRRSAMMDMAPPRRNFVTTAEGTAR